MTLEIQGKPHENEVNHSDIILLLNSKYILKSSKLKFLSPNKNSKQMIGSLSETQNQNHYTT